MLVDFFIQLPPIFSDSSNIPPLPSSLESLEFWIIVEKKGRILSVRCDDGTDVIGAKEKAVPVSHRAMIVVTSVGNIVIISSFHSHHSN